MGTSLLWIERLSDAGPLWLPVLLDGAIKGAVVLLITAGAALALRRASAALRHLVWFLGVASLLVLPPLSRTLPGWHILPRWTAPSSTPVVVAPPAEPLAVPVVADPVQAPAPPAVQPLSSDLPLPSMHPVDPAPVPSVPLPAAPVPAPRPPAPEPIHFSWQAWVLLAWLTGTVVSLVYVALGHLSLAWLQHRATPLTVGPAPALLPHLRQRLGIRRPVRLLSSPRRTMPMTWGLWRTCLLLPATAATWTAQQARPVLLHELAHTQRRDCLTQLVAQVACAMYWFNPLIWLAWQRMQAEREQACDDLVLRAGTPASLYAEQLLHIAAETPAVHFSAAAIAMARPSILESRLLAILDARRNRGSLTRLSLLAILIVALGIAMLAACLRARNDAPLVTPSPSAATSQSHDTEVRWSWQQDPSAQPPLRSWQEEWAQAVDFRNWEHQGRPTYLRLHQRVLDAHPPRDIELLARIAMAAALRTGFQPPADQEALPWCADMVARFQDWPNHRDVMVARIYLAELLGNHYGTKYDDLITTLFQSVLKVPEDAIVFDGDRTHNLDQIATAEATSWPNGKPPDTDPPEVRALRAKMEAEIDTKFRQRLLEERKKQIASLRSGPTWHLERMARWVASGPTWTKDNPFNDIAYQQRLDKSLAVVATILAESPASALTHITAFDTTTQAATSPVNADDDDGYRRLYNDFKTMIQQPASEGNREEVVRLTEKFNQTIGNRLLYAHVYRLDTARKVDTLLSKGFSPDYLRPAISFDSGDKIQVTRHQHSVSVGRNLVDGLGIRLDVKPLAPATLSSPATQPAATQPREVPTPSGWHTSPNGKFAARIVDDTQVAFKGPEKQQTWQISIAELRYPGLTRLLSATPTDAGKTVVEGSAGEQKVALVFDEHSQLEDVLAPRPPAAPGMRLTPVVEKVLIPSGVEQDRRHLMLDLDKGGDFVDADISTAEPVDSKGLERAGVDLFLHRMQGGIWFPAFVKLRLCPAPEKAWEGDSALAFDAVGRAAFGQQGHVLAMPYTAKTWAFQTSQGTMGLLRVEPRHGIGNRDKPVTVSIRLLQQPATRPAAMQPGATQPAGGTTLPAERIIPLAEGYAALAGGRLTFYNNKDQSVAAVDCQKQGIILSRQRKYLALCTQFVDGPAGRGRVYDATGKRVANINLSTDWNVAGFSEPLDARIAAVSDAGLIALRPAYFDRGPPLIHLTDFSGKLLARQDNDLYAVRFTANGLPVVAGTSGAERRAFIRVLNSDGSAGGRPAYQVPADLEVREFEATPEGSMVVLLEMPHTEDFADRVTFWWPAKDARRTWKLPKYLGTIQSPPAVAPNGARVALRIGATGVVLIRTSDASLLWQKDLKQALPHGPVLRNVVDLEVADDGTTVARALAEGAPNDRIVVVHLDAQGEHATTQPAATGATAPATAPTATQAATRVTFQAPNAFTVALADGSEVQVRADGEKLARLGLTVPQVGEALKSLAAKNAGELAAAAIDAGNGRKVRLLDIAALEPGTGTAATNKLAPASMPAAAISAALRPDEVQQDVPAGIQAGDQNLSLMEFEKQLRAQLATGWVPPWSGLDIKASDEELRRMPTKDLAALLISTGVYSREMMLNRDPNLVLKRLEVLHRGYSELLARKDLWQTITSGIEDGAHQLDPNGNFNSNGAILSNLKRLTKVYRYPAIDAQTQGHEREFIKAHISAISSIAAFYQGVDEKDIQPGANLNYLKYATVAADLANAALDMAERMNEKKAMAAQAALPVLRPDPAKLPAREDVLQYAAKAVSELESVLK